MNLKALREQRGLSVRKLGELAGVHYVSIVKMETGKLDPRLSTLQRLADALNVSVSELIGEQPKTKGGKSDGTHKKEGRVVRGVSRRG
ncbi:MAG TPA: XRE family transcriptional regulator [Nitrospiraceae bacterium]|nr:XRE family transcriptional regulator [Nitrospiraceae bacterium]